MLFNTYKFIFVFFPFIFLVCKKIPRSFLLPFITFASYLFYAAAGDLWFLWPMLFTTIFDYFAVIKMEQLPSKKHKRIILYLSLFINLSMLLYFKYSYFIFDSVWSMLSLAGPAHSNVPSWFQFLKVLMPAGISFYTFQTMSYSIDVYRGHAHAEKNFWKFAGFVSFFPHLVAGPITRHNQLLPQLENIQLNGIKSRYEDGLYLFVIGLAKKILIADQIAIIINPMIDNLLPGDFSSSWLALAGFTLQLYFDFSGYSDMAIGLGRLFNVELPQNFNAPYRATNPSDFWKRWHITLSAWLRDYLYISLGGNKKRRYLNLFITMVLGGLWHGANWTFVIWGAFHGLLLIIYHLTKKWWDTLPTFFQCSLNLFLVTIGWLFFRANNFSHLKIWFFNLFTGKNFSLQTESGTKLILLLVISLMITSFLPVASAYSFAHLKKKWQVVLAILFVFSLLLMNNGTKFLYYQF